MFSYVREYTNLDPIPLVVPWSWRKLLVGLPAEIEIGHLVRKMLVQPQFIREINPFTRSQGWFTDEGERLSMRTGEAHERTSPNAPLWGRKR